MKLYGKPNKVNIPFVILMFYLLFMPPVLGKHSIYAVALFSWAYLFFNGNFLFKKLKFNNILWIYLVLTVLCLWVSAMSLLNHGTTATMVHYLYWMVAVFPGAIAVSVHTQKRGEGLHYVLKLILWAGMIQSAFCMVAFVSNPIKLWLVDRLQADGTLVMTTYTNEIEYRLFGFSSGMTFDMPCVMAVIACIGIFLGITKNYKYLLFVPTIAFSAFINARTSIVVMIIGIVVAFWVSGKISTKTKARVLMTAAFALVVVIVGLIVLRQASPTTYEWLLSGAGQILDFFRNETDYGYFEYATDSQKWAVPSGIGLLIGTGCRILGANKFNIHSDIGYINDIWLGGLLYCFAVYSLVALSLIKVKRDADKTGDKMTVRFIVLTYALSLPIMNIKTYIISLGAFTTLLIIVGVYVCTTGTNGVERYLRRVFDPVSK